MGYIVHVNCNCINEQFMMGFGMRDYMAKNQREIGYCPICKTFQPMIGETMCECGFVLTPFYTMDMFEQDQNQVTCPKCGNMATISFAGFWD